VELRQLRYFIAVAEAGSFSRAAEKIHVSQPPLSTQVRNLERELGVRLFDRGNRGASLTDAGTAFLEDARAVLARMEQAQGRARRAERGEVGLISVGFVSLADFGILPSVLKRFRAAHPQVEVELHELTTDAQMRELRASRLDVGIALAPVNEPDLGFERLLQEPLLIAVPLNHPAAKRHSAVNLRDFSDENFIVPPREVAPGLYDLIVSRCRSADFVPRITQHARQMQTVIGLVSSGMGCALVPASVRNLKRPGVQYRTLRGTPALLEIGVLKRATLKRPQVDNFIETLRRAAKLANGSPTQAP
jgi:DNA-binding transcriptional LysR family regulator